MFWYIKGGKNPFVKTDAGVNYPLLDHLNRELSDNAQYKKIIKSLDEFPDEDPIDLFGLSPNQDIEFKYYASKQAFSELR